MNIRTIVFNEVSLFNLSRSQQLASPSRRITTFRATKRKTRRVLKKIKLRLATWNIRLYAEHSEFNGAAGIVIASMIVQHLIKKVGLLNQ